MCLLDYTYPRGVETHGMSDGKMSSLEEVDTKPEEKRITTEECVGQKLLLDPDMLVFAVGDWRDNPYINSLG